MGSFAAKREAEQLAKERIDVTLARSPRSSLAICIRSRLLRQKIEDIFVSMGYEIEDGPEIETHFYNFDALNIPENHPARSPQDTFYLAGERATELGAALADFDHADSRDAETARRRCVWLRPAEFFAETRRTPRTTRCFIRLKVC
jgi:phenylalanyl-tRNA synthetase alpha subunit